MLLEALLFVSFTFLVVPADLEAGLAEYEGSVVFVPMEPLVRG